MKKRWNKAVTSASIKPIDSVTWAQVHRNLWPNFLAGFSCVLGFGHNLVARWKNYFNHSKEAKLNGIIQNGILWISDDTRFYADLFLCTQKELSNKSYNSNVKWEVIVTKDMETVSKIFKVEQSLMRVTRFGPITSTKTMTWLIHLKKMRSRFISTIVSHNILLDLVIRNHHNWRIHIERVINFAHWANEISWSSPILPSRTVTSRKAVIMEWLSPLLISFLAETSLRVHPFP